MGTQNTPKSGSKNESKWGPKMSQNGDPSRVVSKRLSYFGFSSINSTIRNTKFETLNIIIIIEQENITFITDSYMGAKNTT